MGDATACHFFFTSRQFLPFCALLAGVHDVTRILEAMEAGDGEAAAELLPAAYEELRRMAAQKMAGERGGQTLQATALVHEAYLRLAGPEGEQPRWKTRGHFFGAAAEAMRRILIESARRKQAMKRGGDQVRTTMNESRLLIETDAPSEEIIAVDEALAKLEAENETAAQVVKLRYFAGLGVDETASILEISPRTVDRAWRGAKAWLQMELGDTDSS
jgi:RNA polymerase sigma factor (TIGR02999 family)